MKNTVDLLNKLGSGEYTYVVGSTFRIIFILNLEQVIILLHLILYFTDSLPLLQTVFSVTCHFVYLQNFSHSWPLISLSSLTFLSSCALVIADHFIWFFHFSRITHQARYRPYQGGGPRVPGFSEIASFFGICVWLAPLFLFLSLSANDNALPMSTGTRCFFFPTKRVPGC